MFLAVILAVSEYINEFDAIDVSICNGFSTLAHIYRAWGIDYKKWPFISQRRKYRGPKCTGYWRLTLALHFNADYLNRKLLASVLNSLSL